MASIETRKNPRTGLVMSYRVMWRQDGAKQAETFGTRPGALAFQSRVEAAGNRWPEGWIKGAGNRDGLLTEAERIDSPAGSDAVTLAAIATDYLQSDRHRMNAIQAPKALHRLEMHLPGLWTTPAVQITRLMVQARLDELGERWALSTNEVLRSHLSSVFRDWLMVSGIDRANPVTGTRAKGTPKEAVAVYLTTAQFDAILSELAAEPTLALAAETLAGSGLRSGELRALTVADLDLGEHPAIRVSKTVKNDNHGRAVIGSPKTRNSRRTVSIDAELAGMLTARVAGLGPDESVFGLVEQHDYNRTMLRWHAAVQRAGIGSAPRLHDLRHTHASWLLADHAHLFEVSRRLGHATIDITANTYGHLDRHSDRANADRIAARRNRAARPTLRVVS